MWKCEGVVTRDVWKIGDLNERSSPYRQTIGSLNHLGKTFSNTWQTCTYLCVNIVHICVGVWCVVAPCHPTWLQHRFYMQIIHTIQVNWVQEDGI